jgi:hypothetical protein
MPGYAAVKKIKLPKTLNAFLACHARKFKDSGYARAVLWVCREGLKT